MTIISGKALWSIICGHSVLASDEVVGIELQLAADHLKEGLSYYRKFSQDAHTAWSKDCKLKKHQQDFVLRIAKLLDVCSEQSWEIFQLFLEHEYRGSLSQLSAVSENDREETALLNQVFSFYLSDPLHLLSCRRHILVCDPLHPYQELFKDYVNTVLNTDGTFGSSLINQLKDLCSIKASAGPSLHVPSSSLPLNAYHAYTSRCLAAIRHQLATLLVYYGVPGRTCSPESVISLLELAQGVGLGWEFLESVEGVDRSAFAGQLEAINAFHSFLLVLVLNCDSDPLSHPLCTSEWQPKVDGLIQTLGSKPWHLPPLLTWVVLQAKHSQAQPTDMSKETERFSRLSQRAIRGDIFGYLHSALKMPSFETDKFLLELAASITYSLLCSVGSYFDFDKLQLTLQVNDLVQECLAFDPPAHLFWNEEAGGASTFLPLSLEAFPHNPRPLLKIASSLAKAGKESCSKVVEMLKELESFTWMLTDDHLMVVCVSSSQCVTRSTLSPLPGIVIPPGCHGTILGDSSGHLPAVVCWQLPTNGWQVLLASFNSLDAQVKSGAIADPWLVDTVVAGLDTMAAIVSTDREHLPLLVHLEEATLSLFVSISKTSKPNYELIASLFKYFSVFSKESSTSVWNMMESCSLLSSLPPISADRGKQADILLGYRAGSIRSLVCGEEAAAGKYPILKHLCTLLESALSNGYQHANVRGTLVFIVKEVVPVMLQWRYIGISEKVQVIEGVFSLLHHSLEEWFPYKDLQKFVVSELLLAHGGAGNTLRMVLESGASLEATLDQPAEWPQSTHSHRLTRVAQLALSLIHRLVGQYMSKYESETASSSPDGDSWKKMWLSTGPPHLALTIAHFAYHRLNPRLPHLALRTLTHLAKEMSVPLVACLGTEAEGLRDCLITRLGSATEDLWVKVSLLQLLTTSTVNQPGLVRLFLTPPSTLLEPVVALLKTYSTPKNEASMELLAALVETVASLWGRNYSAAASYLRDEADFWENLAHCLFKNRPGAVKDSLVGNIFKIFSLEYFEAKENVCGGLQKAIQRWLNEDDECFKSWIQYIFKLLPEKVEASRSESESGCAKLLLSNCRDFFALLFSRSKDILTDQQKRSLGEMTAEGLLFCFESTAQHLQIHQRILSEIHLILIRLFKDAIVSSPVYVSCLTRILGCLRSVVMQTASLTQVLVLASTLNALASFSDKDAASEFSTSIVNAALLLVEQHCCLASPSKKESEASSSFDCSSPAVLGLSCALLHQCLLCLPPSKTESLLQQSHVTYALVRAATEHSQAGSGAVVKEILRLLSLLARLSTSPDLSSSSLSTSVSLALSTQSQGDYATLSELIWCLIGCLKKEGVSGLEGAVNTAAIHAPAMVASLTAPHLQPELALASAALAATLAPMHPLWRVLHPQCFEQLLTATACCTHRTTKLLHLKETLEREVSGERNAKEFSSTGKLSSSTILLINKLLKILITCLEALRCLSPDFVELLSCPGADVDACDSLSLIQPTCRKLSTEHPSTLPNLATLADILDLCHTLVQKESRSHTPVKRSWSKSFESDVGASIEMSTLNQCAEEALLLLMAHSTLLLMNPNVQRREAREVRTFLADETESFFSFWLGRRPTAAATSPAPPPSPAGPRSTSPNVGFLKLASQLVTSLCHTKSA